MEEYHQGDAKYAGAGNKRRGRWLDNTREDTKEYIMTEDMAENGRQRPLHYYMEKAYSENVRKNHNEQDSSNGM